MHSVLAFGTVQCCWAELTRSGIGQRVGPHRWGRARREGATRAYATAADSAQEAKPPRGSTAHLVAGLQGLLTRTHQHKSSPGAGCTDPGRRQKLLPPSTRAATAYRHSTEAPAERCVSWRGGGARLLAPAAALAQHGGKRCRRQCARLLQPAERARWFIAADHGCCCITLRSPGREPSECSA